MTILEQLDAAVRAEITRLENTLEELRGDLTYERGHWANNISPESTVYTPLKAIEEAVALIDKALE